MSIDEQFVEFVIKSLVTKPEAVQIERRIDEKGVLLELTVDPEDLGRVIGKRGATAQSVRTLLRALGTKNDARYNLKIVDNGVGHENYSPPDESIRQPARESTPEPGLEAEPKPESETKSEPESEEATQADPWSSGSSNDASSASADTEDDESEKESDSVTRTRREMQELDDLDV